MRPDEYRAGSAWASKPPSAPHSSVPNTYLLQLSQFIQGLLVVT